MEDAGGDDSNEASIEGDLKFNFMLYISILNEAL